jgi:hypothetical protein
MIFIINEDRYIDFNSLKEIVDMPKSTLQRELNKMNVVYKKYKNMYLYEIKSLEKNIIKGLN